MSYPGGPMPMSSYPAGGDPNYRPSGGTALTAAGLALPGGLVSLSAGFFAVEGMTNIDNGSPGIVVAALYIAAIGGFLSGLLLLVGAGLIFGGKPAGRWMVVFGCVIVVACLVVFAAMVGTKFSDIDDDQQNYRSAATIGAIFLALFYSIPAIATFILAIVPVSGRYLAYRSGYAGSAMVAPGQSFGYAAPQQQFYGQQPGYPQQQGFPPATPPGFPQQGGFQQPGTGGLPQQGGTYPPSDPSGFPQQPPTNPPAQW